jgi:prevent-host-death family protein
MKRVIKAGKFKAECLKIMDEVKRTRQSFVITKRNKPVAKITPVEEGHPPLFGKMRGKAHIKGDIIQSIGEKWNGDS